MKYPEIRDLLQTGDIVLFRGRSLVSRMIQLATLSWTSHVGRIYREGDDIFIRESTSLNKGKDGVQQSLLSVRIKTYNGQIRIRRLMANRTPRYNMLNQQWWHLHKGKEYEKDLWQLAGAAMPWRNVTDFTSIFCSEYAAGGMIHEGLLNDKMPANEYTPADFELGGKIDRALKMCPFEACLTTETIIEV